jgi:hypothetical protein
MFEIPATRPMKTRSPEMVLENDDTAVENYFSSTAACFLDRRRIACRSPFRIATLLPCLSRSPTYIHTCDFDFAL